nr:MAG TPA: hypothetical protein [Caudoviricetes sp.]
MSVNSARSAVYAIYGFRYTMVYPVGINAL